MNRHRRRTVAAIAATAAAALGLTACYGLSPVSLTDHPSRAVLEPHCLTGSNVTDAAGNDWCWIADTILYPETGP